MVETYILGLGLIFAITISADRIYHGLREINITLREIRDAQKTKTLLP